ncbi:tyrosine-type recombinase/integrase [Myroides pelagicus]|uniref:Tyrosine-type recombinase/integrase n=1 Tax=Myroides pelagicus TaxID=270914 RepID=A0A7K1GJ11_9FLAO|nr:tyrosine-type recombinase/integrase [Myroides pelagicus]MEC4113736.1 tyrosine-type recombinase/integrase [Myroides pelagicus]MTH28806.1 tyrosine-type recombinase/integrase [Myroides pelagicus]
MEQSVQKYIVYLSKEKNYSDKTLEAYRCDILSFRDYIVGFGVDYRVVDYDNVRGWIVCLVEEGLQNRSINRKVSALKGFYQFLMQLKEVGKNPLQLHRSLKVKKKLQIPFSRKEIDVVCQALRSEHTFEKLRDLVIIELLYGLGLRRAELVNLKVTDIDFNLHQVRVIGKGDKRRNLPMLESLEEVLVEYLRLRDLELKEIGVRDALVLNKRRNKVDEMFVYRVINGYFSNATSKEKNSPHVLRHSFASHLIENGADINSIKELMGHESLSTTQMYAQVNLAELKKVYKASHPRMKKK